MSKIKIESEYEDLDKYKFDDGSVMYYKKNTRLRHNPYGPAYISINGYKSYRINDVYHRLDGPAIIYSSGKEEYWINHKYLTKEEFEVHPERLKFLGKEHLICLT